MRKAPGTRTEQALTWPVQVSNGTLLCGRTVSDETDTWYCWAKLAEAPDDPGEFAEISPTALAARIVRHMREFHSY